MDEVIWIEVLSRHRAVLSRHRCTGRGVRIGRAYTNDVVLDDPYVAPEHAHIVRTEDGRLLLEDLGTENGIYAAYGRKRLTSLALADDGVFRLGQTLLRVRSAAHGVAPERALGPRPQAFAIVAALFAAVFLGEALSLWLGDYEEPKAVTYVVPLLAGFVLIGGWTALWSIVSRVFSGTARFEQNLVIALAGALGIELVTAVNALGAFGLSWSMLQSYNPVAFLAVAAAVCFFHLRQINPTRSLVAGAALGALLVAVAGMVTVMERDVRPGVTQLYVRNILPPVLRLKPVESESSFFGQVVRLRSKLDQDRQEAP